MMFAFARRHAFSISVSKCSLTDCYHAGLVANCSIPRTYRNLNSNWLRLNDGFYAYILKHLYANTLEFLVTSTLLLNVTNA